MSNDQQWNRNDWTQLTQGDYLETEHYHYAVPDGYAPVNGYVPVQSEAQNGYSDYQISTAGTYGTHLTQEDNNYAVEDDDIPKQEVREGVSSRKQKRKSKSQAVPKEQQTKSQRAQRREKIGLEVAASKDQPKGLVELREGVLHWWDPTNKELLKAAYHDQFRDQFILEDSQVGEYVISPDRGIGSNDITSASSAFNQLEWRLADRDTWHNVVDADGQKVLYLINRPAVQTYDEPERLWWHNGCVLLDGDNNPVIPWANIPRCFSSKLEGGRMEALRRILPLTVQDFRARMLRTVPTGTGARALSYPSTFGHRSSRFRTQYQTPAWLSRAASAVLKKQVTDLLPEAEDATSTEGLQVLSKYEIAQRKSSTRGKFLYKANGRAISDQEREKRDRKLNERLERQAASQPSTPRRLQSAPITPYQSTLPSPYLPTPPLSAGNKRSRDDIDDSGNGEIDSSEPAAKRGRLAPQTSPEDPSQQAPEAYDPVSTFSTIDWQYGLPDSSAIGLGLDFEDGSSVQPQDLAQSETPDIAEPPPDNAAFTNASQDEKNFQLDHRFVEPQNSSDQLSIQTALFYPRAHYLSLMGQNPPHTSEGSYSAQYLQILTLLEDNWVDDGRTPVLADVGAWYGSFSTVPIPDLPDAVRDILLHPDRSSGLKQERESNDWSDDLFEEYIEDTANY